MSWMRYSPFRWMIVTASPLVEIAFRQNLREAEDGRHRSANFVAHVGQELALGPVGGFCGFVGIRKGQVRLDGLLEGAEQVVDVLSPLVLLGVDEAQTSKDVAVGPQERIAQVGIDPALGRG